MRDIHDRVIGPPEIIVPPRDGSTTHPEEIKAAFRRLNERNPMQVVIMDITDAADIAAWIQDEFPECDVVDRSTGNVNQVKDYDNFTEALRNGWLRHTGHPTLRAHVLNAVAYRLPGGDRKFERPSASRNGKRQDRRVIDALVAAAMVNTDQNDNWDIGGEVMTFTAADLGEDQG
jgi:phage terminase large subunit-like protein